MFFFLDTADGSPTLRLNRGSIETESMHSLRGAFSETDYIYGDAIRWAIAQTGELNLITVGLGLGYIEILGAALSMGVPTQIDSFESVPELRENFEGWIFDRAIASDFSQAYDKILFFNASRFGISKDEVKGRLRNLHECGNLRIHGALEQDTSFSRKYNCIAFDAFSSKTDPELWTPDFLNRFFDQAPNIKCVISTYACTGNLKRALAANGFTLAIRDGYASKRQSMFATKNYELK